LSGICSCEKVDDMSTTTTIEVGKDFSRTPGGRYISDGPDSGELFRIRYLLPALRAAATSGGSVIVVLDGPRGYLSSFIEEAFGGLVRAEGFTAPSLKLLLQIKTRDSFYEPYRLLALKYIREAKPQTIAAAS
jgi:STAS-like domain of unknown function (DUF4325)